MIVSVHTDFWRFQRTLDELGQKQLPFAVSLAINKTARLAQQSLTAALPQIFQKTTPFTKRAIGTTGARKTNLRAEIFVKRVQLKYLAVEEEGGSRTWAKGAPIATPVNASLNAYGNLPRNLIHKLLANPKRYFLGKVRGVYGVWERIGGPGRRGGGPRGVKLIVALRERAQWRPRFGFHQHIRGSVEANFLPALAAGMERAMATAIRKG